MVQGLKAAIGEPKNRFRTPRRIGSPIPRVGALLQFPSFSLGQFDRAPNDTMILPFYTLQSNSVRFAPDFCRPENTLKWLFRVVLGI